MLPSRHRAGVVLGLLALLLATLGTVGIGQPAQARPAPAAVRPRPAVDHARATATLARAQTVFTGSRRQARAALGHGDATLLLRDLRIAYPRLGADEKRRADRLLSRPTDNGANDDPYIKYAGAEQAPECDASICVHYVGEADDATNGVDPVDNDANGFPDYVDRVLATVAHVRSTYVGAGYRPPLADTTSANTGGDGRTDIYLAQLGDQGMYGYCTSDDPDAGDQTSTRVSESAYCVLDNDYADPVFSTETQLQNLQVTAAHEFFHAVQFAYNYFQDPWIMEATATWAEDQLYTGINDNRQYLPNSPLTRPGTPLDVSGMHWYGTWIFFRFLTERQVTAMEGGMPVVVRQLWYQLTTYISVEALRRALAAHGVNLGTAVTRFDLAARHPRRFFREGAAYPTAPLGGTSKVGPGRLAVAARFTLKHLTYKVLQLHPVSGMGSRWRLRLHLDLPDKVRGSAATLWTNYRSGGTASRLIALDSHGNATIDIRFGYQQVRNVEVTIVNASTRFGNHCWEAPYDATTYYSCYAQHGTDDGTTQYVTATAHRS